MADESAKARAGEAGIAQSVVDALESHIAIVDASGRIVAVNAGWRRFASENDATIASVCESANYLDVCEAAARRGSDEARQVAHAMRQMIDGRIDRFELEYPCHAPDQLRWFLARITRLEGDPVRLVVSHENITTRKATEQQLRESEKRYSAWAETSSDLICRHAPDGTYQYVSPACQRILGYEPADLVGRSPYDFFHPDDVARIRASHQHILGSDAINTLQYRLRRRDGQYQWVESTSLAVRDAAGTILEIHSATRDIDARRRQEETLRRIQAAIDHVTEGVVITTAQLELPGPQIVYVNPAFCEMTGYRVEEVLGHTPRILQGPRTDRAALDRLKATLRAGEVFHGTTVNYRKDRREFLVEWQVAPVRDEHGRIINYVSIQRDITEQVRMQEQARQREAELAHVARVSTMGELASGLAHELNQPLSAVMNYTQGCLRRMERGDWTAEPLMAAMRHATDQASRAAEIIRRLRQFIHKRGPKVVSTRLQALIEDAATLLVHDFKHDQIRLVVEPDAALPPVQADAIQIEQVILNLMRNAAEAMRNHGSHTRVLTVRAVRADPDTVRIDVTDTGPGVADADMPRLFEPFYTTKPDGMGLGLSLSQSIVQSHGGQLTARSNPGGGMTFSLTLPIHAHPGLRDAAGI